MTRVFIIRHAEAEGNLYRRMHGQYDSDLTELGKKQLIPLSARFRDIKLDAVYSSDLKRAYLTAGAVAEIRKIPVITTERLREVNLGEWEDRPWGDASAFYHEQLSFFNNDPAKWHVEGSEDFYHTRNRMTDLLRELSWKHEGGIIALVSHGMAIRCLMSAILDIPSEDISRIQHCDNTAVAELTVDNSAGRAEVLYLGDSSHLTDEVSRFRKQIWWRENVDYDASSMRFTPLSPEEDRELYELVRPGGWETACRRVKDNENSVVWALYKGEKAGLIELDFRRDREKGVGWIDWYYMREAWRGLAVSVQLLGHAVSWYRRDGRDALAIISGQNAGYYEHYGFQPAGGKLIKDIKI
ncbi:MAG: GNAT family N-acetyltransferase [Oscillospiraceae bacterium]|nr:GNAT family N-acetyltransferase [Oscillospiraceae bacterium]